MVKSLEEPKCGWFGMPIAVSQERGEDRKEDRSEEALSVEMFAQSRGIELTLPSGQVEFEVVVRT